jgi:tetratricopeptide (TPR) repeat protein
LSSDSGCARQRLREIIIAVRKDGSVFVEKVCLSILALVGLAPVLASQPPPEMLRRLFEEEWQRSKQEYGVDDTRIAQAARDLGLFLRSQGEVAGARDALAEAVHIDEKALGPTAAQTLADLTELARVSAPQQAEPLWRRAAESSDAKVAARALAFLGQLREMAGDRAESAKFYRRALVKEEQSSGQESAQVAIRLNALSRVVDLPEAIALLDRAVAISRRRLGAGHAETATLELSLAGLLLKSGRADQAAQFSGDALSLFEKTLGTDHPRTALAATALAHALRTKGDAGGAEPLYRRALAIDERAYGSMAPRTVSDARTLAEFLRGIGKRREAAELEKRLLTAAHGVATSDR